MHVPRSKASVAVLAAWASLGVAACGSSSHSKSTPAGGGSTTSSSSSGGGSASPPTISATSFNRSFSAMSTLEPLVGVGTGKIAAILPDATSSTRYVEFDAPDLKQAASMAGLPGSDMIVQNGLGSDSTFLTDAESDITNGASVLLIDPEDSGVGVQVENFARAHGVAVVDYDRLVSGGPTDPYVSFNNVRVGRLIGRGLVSCIKAWRVARPHLVVMRGDPTDNNAALFARGYLGVLRSRFRSGRYRDVANPPGTWTPSTALTEFEEAFTAHRNINAAVIPNDENGAPIITYLKSHGVKPRTFPTTGQDATLTGLQNILSGYQCGTVYKPIYLEAQAAVALAMYLRAGRTAPSSLLNGSVTDPKSHASVPSVLETPEWVTTKNMKDTIVKDRFVPTPQLCAGSYRADCKKYGIS